MKKQLLTAIITGLCVIGIIKAQPSLTQAYAFAPGDVYTGYTVDTAGILPGNSGANQTWNFSSIQITGSPSSTTFVTASSTPYASSFTTSTVAAGANGGYDYFKVNSTSTVLMGMGTPNQIQAYSDPHVYYTYPFTYNSVVNDNIACSFTAGGMPTTRTGSSQTTGDGYGTLILPTGTYNNVLRVHFSFTYVDSISGFPTGGSYYYWDQYLWFDVTHKDPLFTILHAGIWSPWVDNGAKTVSVAGWAVGMNENNVIQNCNLFPNPANRTTSLVFDLKTNQNVQYQIKSLTGQIVEKGSWSNLSAAPHNLPLDLEGISGGIYFVSVETENGNVTRKLVIE